MGLPSGRRPVRRGYRRRYRVGGGKGKATDSAAGIEEVDMRGAMVPEGGVKAAARAVRVSGGGKNSLETARFNTCRGPLEHRGKASSGRK